ESSSRGTDIRVDCICDVRRIYRKPGRQVHVLVPQTQSARSDYHSPFPCSELPKLSSKPRHVLGRPVRSSSLPIPNTCRFRSRPCSGGWPVESMGGHSLPDGSLVGFPAWEIGCRRFHLVGTDRRFAISVEWCTTNPSFQIRNVRSGGSHGPSAEPR